MTIGPLAGKSFEQLRHEIENNPAVLTSIIQQLLDQQHQILTDLVKSAPSAS